MRIVAALGGNALLRPGDPLDASAQQRNAVRAALALAPLAAEHELVVTHGNGPQVGLLAMESGSSGSAAPYPLDVLGAESQGMVGYVLAMALRNAIPGRETVTVLTNVEVNGDDPAFSRPTKPIGPILRTEAECDRARARGWQVAPDRGGWRRVVASPEPRRILESRAIGMLCDAGFLVVAAGGGGVPALRHDGALEGIEAVIDKDSAAALLALDLRADWLLLLTDVPGVYAGAAGTGTPMAAATVAMLRGMDLPAGSMGPKAEAGCRFVEAGGGRAAIGAIEDAIAIFEGRAGTQILRELPLASGKGESP